LQITRRQREVVARKRAIISASRAPTFSVPRVKVYPTKANSLNITHPDGTKLKVAGSMWVYDGFFCRMLSDGLITTDEMSGWNASTPSLK
jgi:hypothetical protein